MARPPRRSITVWGRANSANVQKVMWLLGELGAPHKRIDAGGKFGGLDTPQFQALSPHARVPVLVDGETVVFESNACLRYLAEKFEVESLWPAGPRERSQVDRWLEWSHNDWAPAVLFLFGMLMRTPADQRQPQRMEQAQAALASLAGRVEGWLAERPFVAGETMTLADLVFATPLYRYYTLPIERAEAPALKAYYEKMCERPAYAKHVMVDYADLRVPGA